MYIHKERGRTNKIRVFMYMYSHLLIPRLRREIEVRRPLRCGLIRDLKQEVEQNGNHMDLEVIPKYLSLVLSVCLSVIV